MVQVRAAYVFTGALRSSIHRFKYQGERARGRFLGQLLADYVVERPGAERGAPDVVLALPLHRTRHRERGFNQSEILAQAVAGRLAIPLVRGLQRTIPTRPQVGLGAEARRANVRDAFLCDGTRIRGTRVLLIDDVVTTGATMEAAARATLAAGASAVEGLALARQSYTVSP